MNTFRAELIIRDKDNHDLLLQVICRCDESFTDIVDVIDVNCTSRKECAPNPDDWVSGFKPKLFEPYDVLIQPLMSDDIRTIIIMFVDNDEAIMAKEFDLKVWLVNHKTLIKQLGSKQKILSYFSM